MVLHILPKVAHNACSKTKLEVKFSDLPAQLLPSHNPFLHQLNVELCAFKCSVSIQIRWAMENSNAVLNTGYEF